MAGLKDHFQAIVADEARVQAIVAELGGRIARDYEGKPLAVVGLLTGCIPFVGDLVQAIDLPLEIDFLKLSAYGHETQTAGVVVVKKDIDLPIAGKHVLLVDEVLETGASMAKALELLASRHPASIRTCVLVEKDIPRQLQLRPDYVGFTAGPAWIAGYGLDYKGRYRNCPFIGELKPEYQK